jgi:DNA-binding transcriptional LysR family regulator
MDLRQLRYFVAVAEARNLVAAARTLALSQPALTKAIHALEQDCGSKLFERRSRGVVLTPVGEALSIRARLILSEVDRTRSELRALDNGQGGEIHIGALRSVANARLPDAAIEFSAERPSVTLNIEVDQNATLIEGLTAGDRQPRRPSDRASAAAGGGRFRPPFLDHARRQDRLSTPAGGLFLLVRRRAAIAGCRLRAATVHPLHAAEVRPSGAAAFRLDRVRIECRPAEGACGQFGFSEPADRPDHAP